MIVIRIRRDKGGIDADRHRFKRAGFYKAADHRFADASLIGEFTHQPLRIDQSIERGGALRSEPRWFNSRRTIFGDRSACRQCCRRGKHHAQHRGMI